MHYMLISIKRELWQAVDYEAVTDAFATSPRSCLKKLLILWKQNCKIEGHS